MSEKNFPNDPWRETSPDGSGMETIWDHIGVGYFWEEREVKVFPFTSLSCHLYWDWIFMRKVTKSVFFFYPFYTPLWKQVWVGAGIGIAKKRRWEEALPLSRGSIPPWNHFFWSQWNISCSGSQWEKHALRLRPRWLSAPLEMLIASITFAWDQILLTSVVAWLLGIWLVWESQCHV